MLMRIFAELGPWNWMLLGFILLALEILVPGVFLLWIGIAAILTGALSLQLWETAFWGWQVQVLVFLALSLASAYFGKRLMDARRDEETDEPLLNRRAEQLVGRTAQLEEPIREGYGRIRLGDTTWRVAGPDLPAGARVRVVAAKGGTLQVDDARG
ncbi:NfeD family protein [Chelativorans sp. AA-79]|uniref:NfeD family protein n=1 Tax=Chelativorans sp. AA-79 TaxID=3028735 RepID=UPI0023F7FDF6|nr:NfeD family protein [Chelativorans sp. AA-79]WEX11806.1 NfeD family protein [Chelativorans sp. AA-79]